MDTYKDAVALNDLWAGGQAPWRMPGAQDGGAQPPRRDSSATGSRMPRRRRSPA